MNLRIVVLLTLLPAILFPGCSLLTEPDHEIRGVTIKYMIIPTAFSPTQEVELEFVWFGGG
jgi:hypothetical protein